MDCAEESEVDCLQAVIEEEQHTEQQDQQMAGEQVEVVEGMVEGMGYQDMEEQST